MPTNGEKTFAGIEVALTTMRGVAISASGKILKRHEAMYEPDNLIKAVAELTRELGEVGKIDSVGLAIPGLVNRETDRVLFSTGLPSVVRADLHGELMKATGLRFELENDANAAAYGEYISGAGR